MHALDQGNFFLCYGRQSGAWEYTIAWLTALEAEKRQIHAYDNEQAYNKALWLIIAS